MRTDCVKTLSLLTSGPRVSFPAQLEASKVVDSVAGKTSESLSTLLNMRPLYGLVYYST